MRIGSISACIAGDTRYTSFVEAYRNDEGLVVVVRRENSATGGYDGPGGADPYRTAHEEVVQIAEGASEVAAGARLVAAIKRAFDTTVTRYGKPTLRWAWCTGDRGLSASKAGAALRGIV